MDTMAGDEQTVPAQATVMILGRCPSLWQLIITAGTGYSILYEDGSFKQTITDGWQSELPDYWLPGGDVWLEPVPEHTVEVRFGGQIRERWDGAHHMVDHQGYSTVMAVP